jgi:alkaline phosphatase D
VFEVFDRNWPNPPYGHEGLLPGCWFGFDQGPLAFTMLDGRAYRVRRNADEPTMLGAAQRAWLDGRIARAEGRMHLLVSPVPWTFLAKGNSPDTWNGFRGERDEILAQAAVREAQGGPVPMLLSADRHRSDAWFIERADGEPWSAVREGFHELNSSRLTNQHVHKTMPEALLSYNQKQSFGEVIVDTRGPEVVVTYRVIDLDGVVRAELTFRP